MLLLVLALVASLCVVAFLLFYPERTGAEHSSTEPVRVEATTAPNLVETAPAKTSASTILNASGYVTARQVATVSAEVMGRLVSVDVEEGMLVQKGQVLATLDHTLPEVDWQLAEAQVQSQIQRLASLRTEMKEAQRVLARVKSLDASSFASEAQVTRAQADVDKLQTDILSLEAELDVSRLRAKRQKELLEDYTIRAPFAGVVTVKNAQAGEIVAPTSAGGGFTRTGICTLVDMDSLEIEVDVNEAYIGRVYAGQKVSAQLDAYPQWTIHAQVIAVIPAADRSKATVRVRVEILEKDARILPDMGVKVAFHE